MLQSNDYVIVVRTYKRYEMFKKMTYQMLVDQNIDVKNKLYIVVANEDEKSLYEQSLEDCKYNRIIVSEVGGHKAIQYACDQFNNDTPMVFMDDDLEYFFEFTDTPDKKNFVKKSKNLEQYILDGFDTLVKHNMKIFTFAFYQNDFYIKDKPFKQFRPFNIPGGFFCALNSEDIITDHAHLDDIHRTCKYIDKYGGTLIYNWCGFETKTGENEGGMQASGDRGDNSTRMEVMKNMCHKIYEIPYVKKYCKEPVVAHTGMWELKLKTITQIKKLKNFQNLTWAKYFQSSPDNDVQEKLSLSEFM